MQPLQAYLLLGSLLASFGIIFTWFFSESRRVVLPCLLAVLVFVAGGCLATSARIDGGSFSHKGLTSLVQHQGQDAKQPTTTQEDSERTENLIVPAGSLVMVGTNSFKVSSNTTYSIVSKDHVSSIQGGAQKNVLGDTIAKLSSLKWLSYLGVVLFLFGIATAVYPPLKVIVGGSLTTSAAIAGGGLLLTVLPVLVVGHEILILCGVLGAVGIWWFARHHGAISGELSALKTALTGQSASDNTKGS